MYGGLGEENSEGSRKLSLWNTFWKKMHLFKFIHIYSFKYIKLSDRWAIFDQSLYLVKMVFFSF